MDELEHVIDADAAESHLESLLSDSGESDVEVEDDSEPEETSIEGLIGGTVDGLMGDDLESDEDLEEDFGEELEEDLDESGDEPREGDRFSDWGREDLLEHVRGLQGVVSGLRQDNREIKEVVRQALLEEQEEEEEEPLPDKSDDPWGHVEAKLRRELQGGLGAVSEDLSEVRESLDRKEATEAQKEAVGAVVSQVQEFAQDVGEEEFSEALGAVRDHMEGLMRDLGYSNPKAAARAQENRIAMEAVRQGRSPAAPIYKLGKRLLGRESGREEREVDRKRKGLRRTRNRRARSRDGGGKQSLLQRVADMPKEKRLKIMADPVKKRKILEAVS